jgi:hypothetical protein
MHTPAVWQLDVPPRLHVFLWLLANDKLLTRNNLTKRRHVDDLTCLSCSDSETCRHLFFDCFVAKLVWSGISDLLNVSVGSDFESVAHWWLSNKKNTVINVVCTATLWSIWKLRNAMCFQGKVWPGVAEIWGRISFELDRWKILLKDAHSELMAKNIQLLDKKHREVLHIAWK